MSDANPLKWAKFSKEQVEEKLKQLIDKKLLTPEEANNLSSTERERLTHSDVIEPLLTKEITPDFVKNLSEKQWQTCTEHRFNSEIIEKIKQETQKNETPPAKTEEPPQSGAGKGNSSFEKKI